MASSSAGEQVEERGMREPPIVLTSSTGQEEEEAEKASVCGRSYPRD